MKTLPQTTLSRWLDAPDPCELPNLVQGWRDIEVVVTLVPVALAPDGFGANLRRSFLGALAPGASPEAQAGTPCPWEPPCALDVFLREQLRHGGDGLPKPYLIYWQQQGPVMAVSLRMFGTACDWGQAAAEALVAGLSGILPWEKALRGQVAAPVLHARHLLADPLPEIPDGPLTLRLTSPMDDEGAKPGDQRDPAARILSRAIRRVDAMARWQGLALTPEPLHALTEAAHAVEARSLRLKPSKHESPNRHGQKRVSQVVKGEIDLPPLPDDLRLLLALTSRCHLGRHTNEGLGRFELVPTQKPLLPPTKARLRFRATRSPK